MKSTNTRRCIAVIMAKPEKDYQSSVLEGIYKVAFEHDFNVAVFGATQPRGSDKAKEGELRFIKLADYRKFAGVIYMPDTMAYDNLDEMVTQPLLNAAEQYNIPMVTIDYKIGSLPCYFCDDSEVVLDMLEHLKQHGCKDIAYMTGPKGHPHSEQRLDTYMEFMKKQNVDVTEDRIFYGDFWYNKGEEFVEQLMNSKRGLPDAVACANMQMAQSVYNALLERNVSVPGQVLVTGFGENLHESSFISATIRKTSRTGYEAGLGLIKLMNGENVPERSFVKCESISLKSITCGCSNVDKFNLMSIMNKPTGLKDEFFSEGNVMNEMLISGSNYSDMLWSMNWYTYFIEPFKGLYIALCEGWDDPISPLEELSQKTYTEEMIVHYYRENFLDKYPDIKIGESMRFPSSEIFPLLFRGDGEPAAYLMRSLHFEDRCFGYAIITNGQESPTTDEMTDFWLNNVAIAFESQRRLQNMRYLYGKMQENAITDLMTGLLNRNGFNLVLPTFLEEALLNGYQTLLLMGDLNNLKYINDTYGHAEGDAAIKTAAGALSRTWIGGAVQEKNFRIGGDEFVKVAYGHFTEQQMEEFRNALHSFLDTYNSTSGKPYPVHISLGFNICEEGQKSDIEAMLFTADKQMYEDKQRIKKETGFDPKRT